jgi:DNA-binding NarL/FixJ family response regulator/class 3 adenylate cyclase
MPRAGRASRRSVLTVLFADIVGSTALAAELGDRRWQKVMDRHNALVRTEVGRHDGRKIGSAGDGFLAVFDTPADAIACADAIVKQAHGSGTPMRAGLHTGECEDRGDELHGIAVHIASRVQDMAGVGEILVSATVKDLVAGSGIRFADRGSHKLRGVPGKWQTFAVADVSPARRKAARSPGTASRRRIPTVMVVDDHPMWRDTLTKVIEQGRAGKVVAEASDGTEVMKVAAKAKPDVVVMDMHLPGTDGAAATRTLMAKQPGVKVLMLSSSDAKETVLEAVRSGASGYLIKTAESDEITDAVRRIHAGELVFPPALADLVLAELRGEGAPRRTRHEGRVAIAAANAIDREGLAKVLNEAGFDVKSEARDAAELVSRIGADPPDVAIVDIGRRPKQAERGLEAVRKLRSVHPEVGLLVLADDVDAEHALVLIEGNGRGAGYLLRDRLRDVEELSDAVRRVIDGESVIDPEVVSELVVHRRKRSPLDQLTEREREVLALMAEGRSNQAICEALHLSPKSIEGHVGNIFAKLALEPAPDDHRRVLAVLAYLQASS